MKTKQILMAGALALSMVLSGGMLTGCSNSSNTKDTKTSEVAKKKEVKTLGKKTKDSKSLKFTNNTGKKITVFETKSSSEESFSDNLLEDGDADSDFFHCYRIDTITFSTFSDFKFTKPKNIHRFTFR